MLKNENDGMIDPFKVFVRVRPFLEREINFQETNSGELKNMSKPAVLVEDNLVSFIFLIIDICIRSRKSRSVWKKEKCFAFDDVFKERDDNKLIFDKIVNLS